MWGKSFAAALLGLPLTAALIGLIGLSWPGPQHITTLPWLLMAFPVWTGIMSSAFVFRSGLRAWLWLGGATVLAYGLLYALKSAGLIGVQA